MGVEILRSSAKEQHQFDEKKFLSSRTPTRDPLLQWKMEKRSLKKSSLMRRSSRMTPQRSMVMSKKRRLSKRKPKLNPRLRNPPKNLMKPSRRLQETRPHLKRKRPQPKTRLKNDFRSAASTF